MIDVPATPFDVIEHRALAVPCQLRGMRKSVQTELDEFFAHLKEQAQLVYHVSEQAFAKARAKLSVTAIPGLNDWLVERADTDGYVRRWRGMRLVAADASTLCVGRRASHVARAANAEQIAFGLYLPGAAMMLAASLHPRSERQMLFQHLDRLSGDHVLLMDRGYPSRWLVAVLNARGIGFGMRVEKAGNAGFACVRDFLRSGEDDRTVTLPAPDRRDANDYESGLSQQAAWHDFAAKILCDNLQAPGTETAHRGAALSPTRRINRAAAHSILKPRLPALLLGAAARISGGRGGRRPLRPRQSSARLMRARKAPHGGCSTLRQRPSELKFRTDNGHNARINTPRFA